MSTALIIVIILVVLALILIGMYNNLVRLRNQVKNAWSQIDVQLQRRYDLIPNLVNTVKGYAAQEAGVLEKVTQARTQAMGAQTIDEKLKDEIANWVKEQEAAAELEKVAKAKTVGEDAQEEISEEESSSEAKFSM